MKILIDKFASLKKIPIWILLVLVFLAAGFVIYNSRQIFHFTYESEYYENLYYHSQWNIVGSTRGISDSSIYKFVGFRLVQGENPFYINYEVPPFGKYLYGLAEYFLENPYWVSLAIYILTILTFYLLSEIVFKEKKYSLLVLLLFITTPFIASQLRDTMLDLPLTFFYLVNVFFFVKFLNKPRLLFLGLSGIALGLATGTKIGVYTLPALALGLGLIIWESKKIQKFWKPIFYLGSVFGGYVFSYVSYFLHHPNPIPWIRLHKKQLDFYLGSENHVVDYLNQWRGIFLNTYEGWWKMGKTSFGDWSLVLPLGVIAAFVVFVLSIRKKEKAWIYISGLTIIFLVVNSLIDFFPRYLMPAIPGFILLIAYFARKFWWVLLILAVLNLPFLMSSIVEKNYYSSAEAVGNFISKRAYRELYRSIDPEQRKSLPESEFIKTLENFYQTLRVEKISAEINGIKQVDKKLNVSYKIKYLSEFGELNQESVFEFKDYHNQTMLVWKWDYVWPGFVPDKKITIEKKNLSLLGIRRGGIFVARQGKGEKIYIITRHVQWPNTLQPLSELIGKSTLEVADIINQSIPDDFPRFIGVLNASLGEEGRKKALDIKGVKLYEFDYLIPEPGSAKHDIDELVYQLYKKQPEHFFVNADIYFENNGEKVYIKKATNEEGLVLDL